MKAGRLQEMPLSILDNALKLWAYEALYFIGIREADRAQGYLARAYVYKNLGMYHHAREGSLTAEARRLFLLAAKDFFYAALLLDSMEKVQADICVADVCVKGFFNLPANGFKTESLSLLDTDEVWKGDPRLLKAWDSEIDTIDNRRERHLFWDSSQPA